MSGHIGGELCFHRARGLIRRSRTRRRLRGEGLGLLLVEQNAKLTFGVTSHCLVMENGSVAMSGTSEKSAHDERVRHIYLGL